MRESQNVATCVRLPTYGTYVEARRLDTPSPCLLLLDLKLTAYRVTTKAIFAPTSIRLPRRIKMN